MPRRSIAAPHFLTALLLAIGLQLIAPNAADAQVQNLLERRLDAGVLLPPTSVATEQSTFALSYNPAGLLLGPTGFGYLHEEGQRSLGGSRRGDALFARLGGLTEGKRSGLALGAGLEWVRDERGDCDPGLPCTRRTSLGLAFGGPQLAFGIAWRHLSTDEDPALDGMDTWDAGFVFRPGSWLSVGGLVTAFNGPSFPGNQLPRLYTAGVGLRPFGHRLTLAGDFSIDDHDGLDSARFAWLAGWRVLPALELIAQVAHPLRDAPGGRDVVAQLAIRGGFTYSTHSVSGGTGFHGGAGPSILLSTEFIAARGPSLLGPGKSAHVLSLDEVLEGPGPLESLLPGRDPLDPATRLALRLQRLAQDESVGALVLRVRSASGLGFARLEELRSLLADFRQRKAQVVVQLESSGDAEYYLATAADRILVAPQSLLEINGLSSQRLYLRGLLDNLGVTPEFVRAGAFKSAPEQFEREGPSREAAENVDWLLDDTFERYVQAIAQARGLAPQRVREILDEGLMEATRAQELGLVDGLAATREDVEQVVNELAGRRLALRPAGPHPSVPLDWGAVPSIGLVEIKGNILPGSGGSGVAAADRITRELRRAADDPSVRAVVVRVESPGGDVTASELIYAALQETRKRKPVVVSMGDVAASGGYYVALGADHIVAEPGTLTGSIGVFAGKADASRLLSTIGITTARFVRGERADLMSLTRPWTEGERNVVQRVVDRFYDEFLDRVKESRRLSSEQLAEVAGGRVWTGAQAMERGLVDSLGGLSHALAEARRRSGLPANARVSVQSSPGIFEFPEAPSQPFLEPASLLPPGAVKLLASLLGVDNPEPFLLALAASPAERRRIRQLAEVLLLFDGRALALAIDLPVSQ